MSTRPGLLTARSAAMYPLGVYGLSRILFFAVTAAAPHVVAAPRPSLAQFVNRWDATYYVGIVAEGYPKGSDLAAAHAFFPLYPLLVEIADRVLPGGVVTAGVITSLVAGAVAVVLLWHIAQLFAGRDSANRTVLVFCFFPGTIVFGWPYADALLLALMCGAILLLAQGRWIEASVVGAFATATRPSGLVLVAACAIVAYERTRGAPLRKLAAAAAAAAVCVSGFVAFMLWLWNHTGNALQWFDVEREVFEEGRPWRRLPTTLADIFREGLEYGRVLVVLFVVIALVLGTLGVMARQPLWAKVVTVLALYMAVTANIATASPRLQLAAVPAFVAVAARLRRDALVLWCACSAALAVVLVYTYGLSLWVAP